MLFLVIDRTDARVVRKVQSNSWAQFKEDLPHSYHDNVRYKILARGV